MQDAPKVYERKEYIVLKVNNGYIVYNTHKEFSEGHTHLKSFSMAKTLIDNCIKKKRPKTNSLYLLTSHIRVTNDPKYSSMLLEIQEAIKDRGQRTYRNRH